ncbi:MAG TPA: nuclease-related domain-containing protein [Chthoniobacteraceae bacterium]|jgi:hypothetical protein
MVIKTKDPADAAIASLEALQATPGISAQQKGWIEEELANVRSGDRGERDAAYFIDFELGNGKNYAIIHDLRIEHAGRVAQIDHLIIGRMAEIIIIESKNFSTAVRSNERGEFEVKTRYGWKGMNSPVEQNRRHACVLEDFMKASGLLPRRLGLVLRPEIHEWVLVPAQCSIGKSPDAAKIVRMDMFGARLNDWIDRSSPRDFLKVAKAISSDTLREFATALAKHHRPIIFDYAAKFQIASVASVSRTAEVPITNHVQEESPDYGASKMTSSPALQCATCEAAIEQKVATFCRLNAKRFGGKLYCRSCQEPAERKCDECSAPVR